MGLLAGAAVGVELTSEAVGDGQPEPTLAFDCAPPRPGPTQRLGDTLCVGTSDWRRRFETLLAIRSPGAADAPRWSPDGQRLLFRLALSQGNDQRDDIGLINADDSGFVNLSNAPRLGNWGPDWSPDGRRIVFNSGVRLFVMNADGSDLHQITRIWGEFPSWSPDGSLIEFQSNRCNCGSEYDIYTIKPDGSGLRRRTAFPGGESTSGWSPDGRFLAYNRDPDTYHGIWILPRDGGEPRYLPWPQVPGVQLRGATWGRDGSFLVFAIPAGVDPQTATQSFEYRVSADGGTATKLLDDASSADWRPSGDGKAISRLSLTHRWLTRSKLLLSGRLTVGGAPTAGRRVAIGRLGRTLPTKRLVTVTTRPNGGFRLGLVVKKAGNWRFATAFYRGSPAEWSTTAFDRLRR